MDTLINEVREAVNTDSELKNLFAQAEFWKAMAADIVNDDELKNDLMALSQDAYQRAEDHFYSTR